MTNFILAQLVGGVATLFNITSMLIKSKKKILMTLLLSFVFIGVQYMLLNAYVGAAISIVSIIELVISYKYEKQNKKLPKIFALYYIVLTAIVILVTYLLLIFLFKIQVTFGIADVFAIIAAIVFSISICFDKEINIKIFVTISNVFWIVYAIIIQAYTAIISLGIIIISGIIGIAKEYRQSVMKTK